MRRPWIVLKFGGTSVATAECWVEIARRAKEHLTEHRVWIVASALGGATNLLEQAIEEALDQRDPRAASALRALHEELADAMRLRGDPRRAALRSLDDAQRWLEGVRLTGEAGPRLRARILASGELASTRLGAQALRKQGLTPCWVDARELLRSEARPGDDAHRRFLAARVPAAADPRRVQAAIGDVDLVLTQGFIASTQRGETCVLGRGGSDTSAALLAVLIEAAELEIWTDVPGLFTADPRSTPSARLIRRIGYREAQELAAMGAKVLHPRCLPPVSAAGIPVSLRSTREPELEGTRIGGPVEQDPAVTAVTCRTGITLVTLSTWAMWETPGFLARAFAPFAELGLSVDLVATSQSAVSLTLDRVPDDADGSTFEELIRRLESLGQVEVRQPCAVVSIVGRRIRSALDELGPALASFQEHPVYLISDSSEDLNLSFVVQERDGQPLVSRLHGRLFPAQGGDPRLGETWEKLRGVPREDRRRGWWREHRAALIEKVSDGCARYVYNLDEVGRRVRELRERLPAIDRFYYSMKANPHVEFLRRVTAGGFGLECVSWDEVEHARHAVGSDVPLLFTPNFCPPDEYRRAFDAGAEVTVDAEQLLEFSPQLFGGREIGIRIDPGRGLGHHPKVRTAGAHTKFGIPLEQASRIRELAGAAGVQVVGLHAHVGSGILDPQAWGKTGRALARLLELFPTVRWLDVGGGLGVPSAPGEPALDLEAVQRGLASLQRATPGIELRLEPGRWVVSEAGVLVAPVTQVRRKGGANFIGLSTGMNSLLRPALYGAWHAIHNLSRLDAPGCDYWHVVGPICETSDVLGHDRWLPETHPGDVLLIENAGAYGAVMSSRYNLREPAEEVVIS